MSLIVSQEVLADGMRVTCTDGTVYVFTSDDLPNPIKNGTLVQCETFCNNHLASLLAKRDFNAKVHVTSIVPLKVLLVTSTLPIPDYAPGLRPWERVGDGT